MLQFWQTLHRRMSLIAYSKLVEERWPNEKDFYNFLVDFHKAENTEDVGAAVSTDYAVTMNLRSLSSPYCGHFYVEASFVDLVSAQAKDFPSDAVLVDSDYLTPYGFVGFEKPIVINDREISWVTWSNCKGITVVAQNGELFSNRNMTAVGFYCNSFHEDTGEPYGNYESATLAEGTTCSGNIEHKEYGEPILSERAVYRRKVFYTLITLLRQRIAVHKDPANDHRTRITIAKARSAGIYGDLKVVTLRRPNNPYKEGTEIHRQYQCQWTVIGHWRQQPYKSTGQVRPIFIDSYIKGPADKPLKVSVGPIFVARR